MDIDRILEEIVKHGKEKKDEEKYEIPKVGRSIRKLQVDIITGDVIYDKKYNLSKIKNEEINNLEFQKKYELLDVLSKDSVMVKIGSIDKFRSVIRGVIDTSVVEDLINKYVGNKGYKRLQKKLSKKGFLDNQGVIRLDAMLYYGIQLEVDKKKSLCELVDIVNNPQKNTGAVVVGNLQEVVKYYDGIVVNKIRELMATNDMEMFLEKWPIEKQLNIDQKRENEKIRIGIERVNKYVVFRIKELLNYKKNEQLNRAYKRYVEQKKENVVLDEFSIIKIINKMTMLPEKELLKMASRSVINNMINRGLICEHDVNEGSINTRKKELIEKIKYYTVTPSGKTMLLMEKKEKIKKDYAKKKCEYTHDSMAFAAYEYFLKNIKKENEKIVEVYNDIQLKSMAQKKDAMSGVLKGDKIYLPDMAIVVKNENDVESVYSIELAVKYAPKIIKGKQGAIKNLHWFTNNKNQAKSIMRHGKTNRVYCV